MRNKSKTLPFLKNKATTIWKGVWLFPLVLGLFFLILVSLKISGTSVGVYNQIFNGSAHDSNLILNKPRMIRSDEWLTNTQMTIAQVNSGNPRINPNIGNGQDMTVILDVPTKDWSTIFKPQNWSFFILGLEHAFAFKWWLMAYLLIISCYFFVLKLLPGKRLLATSIALTLFFSAFVQWWYQYITLAPIYYSLLVLISYTNFVDEKSKKKMFIHLAILSYLLASFALVMYPPFQIPCALIAGAFAIGYLLEKTSSRKSIFKKLLLSLIPLIIASAILFTFLTTRSSVINTIQNTAYPGKRVVTSGGYDAPHLFSGNLAFQFQFTSKSDKYVILEKGIQNQSETSNFMPLALILFLPSALLLIADYRSKNRTSWSLVLVYAVLIIFIIRMFTPYFNSIFKLLLLDIVPHSRLLIGIGLGNLLVLTLFIRQHLNNKSAENNLNNKFFASTYSVFIGLFFLLLGIYTSHRFPGFIEPKMILSLTLPLPIFVYFLLQKKFEISCIVLLFFVSISSGAVHPLYRGLDSVTDSKLANEINKIRSDSEEKWVTEGLFWENQVILQGIPSISGLYSYPQNETWKLLDDGSNEDSYNRYAHVNFAFNREPEKNIETDINLVGGDNFHILSEPCSNFVRDSYINYAITIAPLNGQDSCATLLKTISYPLVSFYIYRFSF